MNTDVIRQRKSVRTYQEKDISPQLLEQITQFLKQDTGILGGFETEYIATYQRED